MAVRGSSGFDLRSVPIRWPVFVAYEIPFDLLGMIAQSHLKLSSLSENFRSFKLEISHSFLRSSESLVAPVDLEIGINNLPSLITRSAAMHIPLLTHSFDLL